MGGICKKGSVKAMTALQSENTIKSEADLRKAEQQIRRVNVDFPVWMIESLDAEARRLGVSRQSVIKVWIADALKERTS
jgi:hypothetical protein